MVDQVFSRISSKLARNKCYTLETFATIVKDAYNPAPKMVLLEDVIDIQEWLEPVFVKGITGMKNSLQFLITRDENSPCGSVIRSKPDSASPAFEDSNLLCGVPSTKPMVKAGRPLFHRQGGTSEQADKDYGIFEAHVRKLFLSKNFFPHQVESWERLLKNIKVWESKPAREYPLWWPLNKLEASKLLGDKGAPSPTQDGEVLSPPLTDLTFVTITHLTITLFVQSCSKDKSKRQRSSALVTPSTHTGHGEALGQEPKQCTAT